MASISAVLRGIATLFVAGVLTAALLAPSSPAAATTIQTPTISVAFGADSVPHDTHTSLTFTVYNPNSSNLSTPTFGFTTTLPTDSGTPVFQVAPDATDDSCGGVLQVSSTTIGYTGGVTAAQTVCVVTVDVTATDPGGWLDQVVLTASNGGSAGGSAYLTVVAGTQDGAAFSPGVYTAQPPRSVRLGAKVPFTVDLYNPNTSTTLTGVGFTDTIPAGFVVASPAGVSQSCASGAVTAVSGGHTFTVSGATLDTSPTPTSECAWTVTLKAVREGAWTNAPSSVTSTEGGAGSMVAVPTISVLSNGPRVIWSNASGYNQTGTFGFAALDGSGAGDLLDTGRFKYGTEGFTLDPARNEIDYVSSTEPSPPHQRLFRAPLTGADASSATSTSQVDLWPGVALDTTKRRVYWSDGDHVFAYTGLYRVETASVDPNGHSGPAIAMVIDNGRHRIYWSNGSEIAYAALDGSHPHTIVTDQTAHLDDAIAIAVDTAADRVYWANYIDSTIGWASLDGVRHGRIAVAAGAIDEPQGIAVDTRTHRLYWTNGGGNSIGWASSDGTRSGLLDTDGSVIFQPFGIGLLEPPVARRSPTISGGSTVGTLLRCSGARWASDASEARDFRAPRTVTTRWLRNGHLLARATGPTYRARSVGRYTCRRIAANPSGSTTAGSAQHSVRRS